ncbi:MAG: DUF3047 domain-containing protein [Rhodospirillales bacterium]|jgi:hypothetical protein|nr:DUF3047 domain-containing protein [Rhodospirillales bacterium]HIJ42611.1 DUF3047 domain-containing protein [Rhodospirillaceae bacterium]MDP7099059.1 DUF3047 domain-containing protein [Rhodospirillales bacterium]MDP7215962.1 DUF3047 domain-containing protein [Rhodospirillales bacterium]HIJ44869.1 DUF3047 domain-containing protein [Rhodospirillaceae bacterium]
MRISKAFPALLVFLIAAYAGVPVTAGVKQEAAAGNKLFDAETVPRDQWKHLPLRGETKYRLAVLDGRVAIRAVGRDSASVLIRRVDADPTRCPVLEWSWSATKIQPDADLRVKNREDVTAAIFLLFGDPGSMFGLAPVPTLRYVWTNGNVPVETVVVSPYMPGTVRSVVVESGEDRAGTWVTERRNVVEDFERAFGRPPKDRIQAIALFTDNDQTKQPVEAYYGWARMVCAH